MVVTTYRMHEEEDRKTKRNHNNNNHTHWGASNGFYKFSSFRGSDKGGMGSE